jgi:hypothetical protein
VLIADFGGKLQLGKRYSLGLAGPATACSALTDPSSPSTFLLVERGECVFTDKLVVAQAAGAAGVLLMNDRYANQKYHGGLGFRVQYV